VRSIYARLNRRYGPRISGDDRRRLVRQKVELQAPLPAIAPRGVALAPTGQPRAKVAVVGAGFAGLMAGYSLASTCDVTVYEARDRIGGRVWTKYRPGGGVVEAGGELIGYNHPLWLKLARHFGLGFSVITQDTNFDALDLDMPLYLGGRRVTEGKLEDLYTELSDAFSIMTRQSRRVDPERPWRALDAEKFDRQPLSEWIATIDCSELARLALEEQFTNDAGTPTSRQSYLANLAAVAGGALKGQPDAFFTQSETLRCSDGNQALAECLAGNIREAGGKICCNTSVRSIAIGEERVTLELRGENDRAGKDDKVTADYVVLAIPPSLWPDKPQSPLTITPKLPSDCYVSMGTAVKYLSPLTGRFWIADGLAPAATSSEFGVTWEGSDNQIASAGSQVELSLFAGAGVAQAALDRLASGGRTCSSRILCVQAWQGLQELRQEFGACPGLHRLAERPMDARRLFIPRSGRGLPCRSVAARRLPQAVVLCRRTHLLRLYRVHGGSVTVRPKGRAFDPESDRAPVARRMTNSTTSPASARNSCRRT
jgi:monoamine oxidase